MGSGADVPVARAFRVDPQVVVDSAEIGPMTRYIAEGRRVRTTADDFLREDVSSPLRCESPTEDHITELTMNQAKSEKPLPTGIDGCVCEASERWTRME